MDGSVSTAPERKGKRGEEKGQGGGPKASASGATATAATAAASGLVSHCCVLGGGIGLGTGVGLGHIRLRGLRGHGLALALGRARLACRAGPAGMTAAVVTALLAPTVRDTRLDTLAVLALLASAAYATGLAATVIAALLALTLRNTRLDALAVLALLARGASAARGRARAAAVATLLAVTVWRALLLWALQGVLPRRVCPRTTAEVVCLLITSPAASRVVCGRTVQAKELALVAPDHAVLGIAAPLEARDDSIATVCAWRFLAQARLRVGANALAFAAALPGRARAA